MTDKARVYSDTIDRERQKQTGEVFTPQWLVDEMIDRLGPDAMKLGSTILEPAAGDGNFVIRIIERKTDRAVSEGISRSEAVVLAARDVYACEYMKDNRDAIIKRVLDYANLQDNSELLAVLEHNVAHCNTIDPWDDTEGRVYPKWLLDEISHEYYEYMKKKSKFYKKNKMELKLPSLFQGI